MNSTAIIKSSNPFLSFSKPHTGANHSLNALIQSRDMNALPENVQDMKRRVVAAFNVRLWNA